MHTRALPPRIPPIPRLPCHCADAQSSILAQPPSAALQQLMSSMLHMLSFLLCSASPSTLLYFLPTCLRSDVGRILKTYSRVCSANTGGSVPACDRKGGSIVTDHLESLRSHHDLRAQEGMSEAPLGPNDIPQLYECLKTALSQDQYRQKQAEATLEGLENRHGFTSCLAVSTRLSCPTCSAVINVPFSTARTPCHAGDHWH